MRHASKASRHYTATVLTETANPLQSEVRIVKARFDPRSRLRVETSDQQPQISKCRPAVPYLMRTVGVSRMRKQLGHEDLTTFSMTLIRLSRVPLQASSRSLV